ncbi:MAG: hypothetical protein JO250_10470 [Armatimonadetes bacterium]|nr:hypothetical protein [Armatimonadota bacterium]
MSALTGPYDARRKEGGLVRYPVAANTEVFKGGLAVLSGGYAQPGADAAGVIFIGVFAETVNNTAGAVQPGQIAPAPGSPQLTPAAGAAGAYSVRVEKTGAFVFNKAGAAQADLGKPAFVVDDNTVSTAATTNNVACGYVTEIVDASHVRVRIDRSVQ